MKIQHLPGTEGLADSKGPVEKEGLERSAPFSTLLDREVAANQTRPQNIESPASAYSIDCMGIIPSILPPEREDQQALEVLETVMGHLEGLEHALGDDKMDPQAIKASLDNLSRSLPGLREEVTRLPEQHPLRLIGEEMSVLCYVESAKWNRGDYAV
jgi:hypothetical protein